MANFWKRLTEPEIVLRDEAPADPNPFAVAITYGIAADLLSGPESSFLEKAMFVAYPFVINAAGLAGAQKGMEDRA